MRADRIGGPSRWTSSASSYRSTAGDKRRDGQWAACRRVSAAISVIAGSQIRLPICLWRFSPVSTTVRGADVGHDARDPCPPSRAVARDCLVWRSRLASSVSCQGRGRRFESAHPLQEIWLSNAINAVASTRERWWAWGRCGARCAGSMRIRPQRADAVSDSPLTIVGGAGVSHAARSRAARSPIAFDQCPYEV